MNILDNSGQLSSVASRKNREVDHDLRDGPDVEDQWAKSDPLVDGMNLNIDQLDDHDNEVAMISQAHLQNMMKKKRNDHSRDEISHNEIEL